MPFPTMARGLLGYFLGSADPPATDQRATTPPVRSRTFLSLHAILAARDRKGMRGVANVCRSLRNGRGGSTGAGERKRNG